MFSVYEELSCEVSIVQDRREEEPQRSGQQHENYIVETDNQSQLHYSINQVVVIQNQNRNYKQKLSQKQEQLVWMSQKSFVLGRTLMKIIKERDIIYNKYETLVQSYKKVRDEMKISKVQNNSVFEQLDCYNSTLKLKIADSSSKLQHVLEFMKKLPANESHAQIINFIKEAKTALQ